MVSRKYLFVLCPPFSGSTVLWQLLATSPNVSALPTEGQFADGVKDVMWGDRWSPEARFPWSRIKEEWEQVWDMSKPVLLEKSPPHLVRAHEIAEESRPAYFILMVRNPYAFCEGYERRLGLSVTYAAAFWVSCAQHQVTDIDRLEHLIHVTYEELARDPREVCSRILRFIPELGELQVDVRIAADSIMGLGSRRIRDLNQIKINQLSARDLA